VSGSTIGIKVADGSYYPVLEQSFTGRKILTLTTVTDDQTRVQIDLYRGDGGGLAEARYIGSLIIENIPPAPRGEPEIQLAIGLDEDGELDAEASDSSTGESQKFAISLKTLSDEETYEIPEFQVEEETEEEAETPTGERAGKGEPEQFDFEEPPLTGESYPSADAPRKTERQHRYRPSVFLIVLFCVLGVLLLSVVGYIVYSGLTGSPVQLLPGAGTEAVPGTQDGQAAGSQPAGGDGQPAGTSGAVTQGQQPPTGGQASGGQAASGTPAASEQPAAPAVKAGVTYRVRKGDTLWDISSTYYRNPWLYPRLAEANSIKNPDLILAGAKIFIPED